MSDSAASPNRILLVEDNPEMRDFTARALLLLGYAAIEAGDGASALASLEEQHDLCLLLTDVMLPGGLNGVALARRARDLRPDLKVMFVSGYADSAIGAEEMRRLGATMLARPFRVQELKRRLEQVVGR